jgi:ABC-type multidrug transport system ATPase subunit
MADLGISHIADRNIGDALKRGISGGEKRRVGIAVELVVDPRKFINNSILIGLVVLFLDEPTTGLDAHSALIVMNCINDLAKQGRTVIFSIHQPRPNIFDRFDELILLNEGNIVYQGDKEGAVAHFKNQGFEQGGLNTADYLSKIFLAKN